jgi:hypothetical protein
MILKLRTVEASTKNKTLKQYDKLVNKYENKEQLNVRMQRTKTINKEKKIVAKKKTAADKIQKLFKKLIKSKKITTYQIDVSFYSYEQQFNKQRPHKGMYFISQNHFEVKAPNPFPPDLHQQLVKKSQKIFNYGVQILSTDKEFVEWMASHVSLNAMEGFKIRSIDILEDSGKKYSPLDEGLTDATHISCNYNYIETKLNLDKKTFLEAIKNEKYIESECWINSITDFYGDTLMSNKKRNVFLKLSHR